MKAPASAVCVGVWVTLLSAGAAVADADADDPRAVQLTAVAERKALAGDCDRSRSSGPLVRELDPIYYREVFATRPAIQACLEPAPRRPRSGGFVDLAIGAGIADSVYFLAGPSLGAGAFVSPRVALSFRITGVTLLPFGLFYVGAAGPAVQLWHEDRFFVGGGLGAGFVAGCDGACGGALEGVGLHLRTGVAFDRGAAGNLSMEVMSFNVGGGSFTTASLLLGYQTR